LFPLCDARRCATFKVFKERRHPMTSIFLTGSVLEIGLVIFAGVIFVGMIVVALAVIVWTIAGLLSATHQYPASHH
jgi:hypothetical protein